MKRAHRYLLGDSRLEAARLRAQARLWDPTAHALFDRLGVKRGWKVLEIGPGQGSLHLELRRRTRTPVDAVEPSAAFTARLRTICARDGFGQGQYWNAPLMQVDLPRNTYDLIFLRWVFLFLPNPEAHVRKLVRALKPGGLLAVEDYHRETMALAPRPPEWSDFIAADLKFFALTGADPSSGSRLPALFKRAGLSIVEIVPTIRTGHPGSPMWKWVSTYFMWIMDRYAKIPPFSRAKAARLTRAWRAASRDKKSLFIAPAVLDVVGRKPRRR